jgi:hypothetical protein
MHFRPDMPDRFLEIGFTRNMEAKVGRALCAVSKPLKEQAASDRGIFVYPGSGSGIDDRSVAYVGGVGR